MDKEDEIYMKHVNVNFKRAREFTEETLGINLTLIELVELRELVKYTQRVYFEDSKRFLNDKLGGDKHSILPDIEAGLIFLNKNYGLQINLPKGDWERFEYNRIKTKMELGYDYYPEYFRRMQEEMHFP